MTIVCVDEEQGSARTHSGVAVSPVDNDPQPGQLAVSPSSTSSSSRSGSQKKTMPKEAECRICLSGEESASFVQPCLCDGSLKYAHLHCLKSWVHERQRLSCEICKSMYAEALLPELKEEVYDQSGASTTHPHGYTVEGNHSPRVFILPGMHQNASASTHNFRNNNKALINILIIAFVIIVIVVTLVVLGLNASQHTWAAVLLRIIAFGLPLLIIGRAFIVCCEMRRNNALPAPVVSRNTTSNSLYMMS